VLERVGRGPLPPVVMLHGISANALSYVGMFGHFVARSSRIIAPDCPGHGFSDVPRGGLDRDSMQAGMFEALDRVIDEPVVLLGTSMGGFGAMRYAAARPENVRALALVCPGGAPMSSPAEFQRFLDTFRINSYADALAFVDRMLVRSPQGLRHLLAHSIRGRFSHPELRRLFDSLEPGDMLSPDELARLTMPTLLLWGRDDLILPRAHLEFFRDHLPAHAEIEDLANFGHCGFLEQPGAVSQRVLNFVQTTLSGQSRPLGSTLADKRDTLRISA
jgi:pimeloyl-ACP methyl ester carboxylesterase